MVAPAIELTKTVGTDPEVCAPTDEITVFTGTDVHYCYEVMNTGGLTLTLHTLVDDKQGTLLSDFPYDLGPNASVFVTDTRPAVDIMTTNVATWTGQVTYSMPYDSVGSLSQELVSIEVQDETWDHVRRRNDAHRRRHRHG